MKLTSCAVFPLFTQRCVPHEKQLCFGCNELHDSGKSVPQQVPEPRKRRENKCTKVSEMGPIILRSHRVLLTTNPGDKTSTKGKDHPIKADAPVEMKPNYVKKDLSSSMNSSSVCKVEQIEGNTGSRGVDMDGAKISISGGVDSSIQRKCSSVCLDTIVLKMHPSGNNDSTVESKSTLLSSDVLRKRFSTH
ncbi:uncharacterized protein LOC131220405 [Magnolia sinica]|uniref:uncharacterized protein LOC131220405 n=1 Tax=Magnolia sinica TaxID=86752 RepID=UPI00265A44C0|nr:uncharacterized protein LOC131220405 [Magnolia sinica]